MAATTAFLAGSDSNDLELSYAVESVWGTAPVGAYQKFRVNSESFAERKNRTRPPELRSDAQVAAAVTQDLQAQGGTQHGISYGNMDELYACMLLGEWGAPLAISATSISFVNETAGNSIQSTNAALFDDVEIGQWIKAAGAANAANNGWHRVTGKSTSTGNATLEVASTLVDGAAGPSIAITGSMLRNGTTFRSVTIQKRMSSSLGFYYPGTFFTGGQLNAQRGQFFSGTLDALCKSEVKAAAAIGSGFVAAPTKKVMNTVGHFQGLEIDDAPSEAKIMSLMTTFAREGAALGFALGDTASVGLGTKGSLSANGEMEVYFADYDLYDDYVAETERTINYRVTDAAGNTYIVTIPALVLGQSTIIAGGPNQPVMAKFAWGADPSEVYGNTVQIDRFAA